MVGHCFNNINMIQGGHKPGKVGENVHGIDEFPINEVVKVCKENAIALVLTL